MGCALEWFPIVFGLYLMTNNIGLALMVENVPKIVLIEKNKAHLQSKCIQTYKNHKFLNNANWKLKIAFLKRSRRDLCVAETPGPQLGRKIYFWSFNYFGMSDTLGECI